MRYHIEFTGAVPNGIAVYDNLTEQTKHYDLVRIPQVAVVRTNLLGRQYIATPGPIVGSRVTPPPPDGYVA